MFEIENISRRKVVSLLSSGLGGFFLSFQQKNSIYGQASQNKMGQLAPILQVSKSGLVYLYLPQSEMGQGVYTNLSKLVAEELNLNLNKVKVVLSPLIFNLQDYGVESQGTGGSRAIRSLYKPLRLLGANAREMIEKAAATYWQVNHKLCHTRDGMIYGPDSRQTNFKVILPFLKQLKPNSTAKLKSDKNLFLIGHSSKKLDTRVKCEGKARYSIDAQPNIALIYANFRSTPLPSNRLQIDGIEQAKKIPGIIDILNWSDSIITVSTSYWNGVAALNALKFSYRGTNKLKEWNQSQLTSKLWQQLKHAKQVHHQHKASEDEIRQLALSHSIHAKFSAPYLAHCAMEPLSTTINLTRQFCEIWVGTQVPERSLNQIAKLTGLAESQIKIHQHFLGGSFGRRLSTDFIGLGIKIAKHLEQPVKVIWSRENELRCDLYRPASVSDITVKVSKAGKIISWHQRIAGPSIRQQLNPSADPLKDSNSYSGSAPNAYLIPIKSTKYAPTTAELPVSYWRSVGHSQNAFFVESMMNKVARNLNIDPLRFRLRHLAKDSMLAKCLKDVAALAKKSAKKHHYKGVACHYSFGSYVAMIVCIKKLTADHYSIEQVFASVACGKAIDPRGIKRQVSSGIIFGLSAAIMQKIEIKEGMVAQSNYHDYPMLRLNETPDIFCSIVPGGDFIGGAGEVGVPPVAPALAAALAQAYKIDFEQMPFNSYQPQLAPRS